MLAAGAPFAGWEEQWASHFDKVAIRGRVLCQKSRQEAQYIKQALEADQETLGKAIDFVKWMKERWENDSGLEESNVGSDDGGTNLGLA